MKKEIKVIGFYTHNNDLFIYNDWDDRFDDSNKIDFSDTAFKYFNTSMFHAETCMRIEGNVGELKEIFLDINP
jgi:hypothetical protein